MLQKDDLGIEQKPAPAGIAQNAIKIGVTAEKTGAVQQCPIPTI
jgi:hypothetical protein